MERRKIIQRAYDAVKDYLFGEGIYGARGFRRLENWLEDKVGNFELWLFDSLKKSK